MFKSANIGPLDQAVRLIIGFVLAVVPSVYEHDLWANPYVAYGLTIVGLILVLTAVVRFCPLYRLIGTNTS